MFERGDFFSAIELLAPLAAENERIGGSRAQHDLIEFTLLKLTLRPSGRKRRGACSVRGDRVLKVEDVAPHGSHDRQRDPYARKRLVSRSGSR